MRCVPSTLNPSRRKAGPSVARTMARAQSRLAASSLLTSASLMASGQRHLQHTEPRPVTGTPGQHPPRPRRAGQSSGPSWGPRGGFGNRNKRLFKQPNPARPRPPLPPLTAERAAPPAAEGGGARPEALPGRCRKRQRLWRGRHGVRQV